MASIRRSILMLVTEPGPRLVDIVAAAVEGGVDIVQWRDKTTQEPQRSSVAKSLRAALSSPALFVVNGDVDIATAVQADGVHLPEASEPTSTIGLLGKSVHSIDAARRAEHAGADYVVAGTIFESQSHPGQPGAGFEFLRDVCEAVSIPVIAIGGITPENAPDCIRAGAAGVAVLSPIMRAADPMSVAATYRRGLDRV